jgi:AmmeMemoRadiSam system protein A
MAPSASTSDREITPDRGRTLVRLAREAIELELGQAVPPLDRPDWLQMPGATFVTLMRENRLRGCIGSIEPRRPIGEDVTQNAVAAATRDPRFLPMTADELADLKVEVTVLSPLEPLEVQGEADACQKLRPGVDGVVFTHRSAQSTFIPQMWEQLPAPKEFLRYLKKKAGLPDDFWDSDVQLQRFTAAKWREEL